MKNVLCFNHIFEYELLINEAREGNSIWVEVVTDEKADQELEIMVGEDLTTIPLASSQRNVVEVEAELWNLGGITRIRLSNASFVSQYADISFPEVINTDSAIYQNAAQSYVMQGSFDVKQAVEDLQDASAEQQAQIEDISLNLLAYVMPKQKSTNSIPDGSNNDVLRFEFTNSRNAAKVTFTSCLNFYVATTVDQVTEAFDDCTITVTYRLDGTDVATLTETAGDGNKILTLNYMIEDLATGNHVFVVNLAAAGGSIS